MCGSLRYPDPDSSDESESDSDSDNNDVPNDDVPNVDWANDKSIKLEIVIDIIKLHRLFPESGLWIRIECINHHRVEGDATEDIEDEDIPDEDIRDSIDSYTAQARAWKPDNDPLPPFIHPSLGEELLFHEDVLPQWIQCPETVAQEEHRLRANDAARRIAAATGKPFPKNKIILFSAFPINWPIILNVSPLSLSRIEGYANISISDPRHKWNSACCCQWWHDPEEAYGSV